MATCGENTNTVVGTHEALNISAAY